MSIATQAVDKFAEDMRARLLEFESSDPHMPRPRSMQGHTPADSLWLLMRAKRNLDRFIDEMVNRQGHPTAIDLNDAANLMALADWTMTHPADPQRGSRPCLT